MSIASLKGCALCTGSFRGLGGPLIMVTPDCCRISDGLIVIEPWLSRETLLFLKSDYTIMLLVQAVLLQHSNVAR